jgi:hypothetical protein
MLTHLSKQRLVHYLNPTSESALAHLRHEIVWLAHWLAVLAFCLSGLSSCCFVTEPSNISRSSKTVKTLTSAAAAAASRGFCGLASELPSALDSPAICCRRAWLR